MLESNLKIQILNRLNEIKILTKEVIKKDNILREVVQDIQAKSKKNDSLKAEDVIEGITTFKVNKIQANIFNDTINICTLRLIELHQLAITSKIKVDLDEKDQKFLVEYTKKGPLTLVGVQNDKMVILDEKYYKGIEDDLINNIKTNNQHEFIFENILKFNV